MTISDQDKVLLDGHAIEAELLEDWRPLLGWLHARFATGSFATGVAVVDGIGAAADAADHHPDVTLTYSAVEVRLQSHDVGGITQRDIRLAREISDIAGRAGAKAETASTSVLELGLDTPDFEEIKPFWRALLDLEDSSAYDEELIDPRGAFPTVWFQKSEARSGDDPQHWHLDVRVPPEVADARIRAALDAGGTLVSDERAPTFWVLADPQGNQACITTWLGRKHA